MAEAEDVLVEAARQATSYAQELARRRMRPRSTPTRLVDVAARLDLLLLAVHGRPWRLRVAQPPAPVTALTRIFHRRSRPWRRAAVPSSDGMAIWLPRALEGTRPEQALLLYRTMALQQAQRTTTRDALGVQDLADAMVRGLLLVFEAEAADAALCRALPGLHPAIRLLRAEALRRRPALDRFPADQRSLERWQRAQTSCIS